MKFHILTIFPEAFDSYFSSSIMGNAIKNNLFSVDFYKINDLNSTWFKMVTKDGWEMHLDLEKNLQTQIVKIYTFIKEQGLNPADYHYFNARFKDRVYYK